MANEVFFVLIHPFPVIFKVRIEAQIFVVQFFSLSVSCWNFGPFFAQSLLLVHEFEIVFPKIFLFAGVYILIFQSAPSYREYEKMSVMNFAVISTRVMACE